MAYTEQKVSTLAPNDTVNDTVNIKRLSKVIEILKSNSRISTVALAKELDISRITAIRDLNKLKEQGRILRVGSDKTGHWEISTEK